MGVAIILLMILGYFCLLWRVNPQKERLMSRRIYLLERELLRIRARMKQDQPND